MRIHIVQPGQTLYGIARDYGLTTGLAAGYNGLTPPYALAVGQALVLPEVTAVHTVRAGETLTGIAREYGVSPRRLWQLNPRLSGRSLLYPGEVLVVSVAQGARPEMVVSGYAYPFVNRTILAGILPYATWLVPFTYGIDQSGGLLPLEDEALLALAAEYGVGTLMHLSTLTEAQTFSTQRAELILGSPDLQAALIEAVLQTLEQKAYSGVDVDFEYVGRENAAAYAAFVSRLARAVHARGRTLTVALAPKTSAGQAGILYEGHDYAALAAEADQILLMTYEWGYTLGPPMAVAPIPSVRRVLDYAVTEIPAEKILLGFPNYGYDWTLPYTAGSTRAQSISNEYAVQLAVGYGAEIQFDADAATPYFHYADRDGRTHEVWFEDARSVQARLALVTEYGFSGIGVWNFMRPFAQGWTVLDDLFQVSTP